MTFYELIFLRQFSMKLLGLPIAKHVFSFILGCRQNFNFARPFWYGWVETGLNGRNWAEWAEWAKWPGKVQVLWAS